MSAGVAVFHPGVQHAYQTALAFQEVDRLAWFATSIFYDPARWPYRTIQRLPRRWRDAVEHHFRGRQHPAIDRRLVRTFGGWEWTERAASRLGLRQVEHYANEWGNVSFGRRVARLALRDEVGWVWGFDTAGLETFAALQGHGITRVLEQTIAYPRLWNTILREERDRVGVNFDPYPRPYPEADLARVDAELAAADRIVCGSSFVRDSLQAAHVAEGKLAVVPYGADPTIFTPSSAPPPAGALRVLFVGHFGVRKGAWYLIDALERLKRLNGLTLRIVGQRTVPDRYLAPLGDRVHVSDRISRAQMPDVYRAADVLVLPSLFEGSSMVTYEALAAGLPVITTPNAGSVVRDGVEGILVPPRDSEALAHALHRLYDDPRLRQELGAAARPRALAYPWRRYREALVDLVEGAWPCRA